MGRLTVVLTMLLFAGCSAPQDVILDSARRAPTNQVVVARGGMERPYRVIAILRTIADTRQGGDPVAVLLAKAQKLGADALILQPSETLVSRESSQGGGMLHFPGLLGSEREPSPPHIGRSERYVLAGHAVIFQ